VSIDITGTNDAPVISSAPQSGNVSEGDGLPAADMTATGQVTFTDVDTGDTHTLSAGIDPTHCTASVAADGTWLYTASDAGAVHALAVGVHLADSFPLQSTLHPSRRSSDLVSLDITGTNDAPVIISAPQSGNVSEGDGLSAADMTATGQVTFT